MGYNEPRMVLGHFIVFFFVSFCCSQRFVASNCALPVDDCGSSMGGVDPPEVLFGFNGEERFAGFVFSAKDFMFGRCL